MGLPNRHGHGSSRQGHSALRGYHQLSSGCRSSTFLLCSAAPAGEVGSCAPSSMISGTHCHSSAVMVMCGVCVGGFWSCAARSGQRGWETFLKGVRRVCPGRGVDSSQLTQNSYQSGRDVEWIPRKLTKIRNLSSAPIERVLERFPLPPVFPAIAGAGRSRRVNPRDNSLPLRPLLFLWERAAHL